MLRTKGRQGGGEEPWDSPGPGATRAVYRTCLEWHRGSGRVAGGQTGSQVLALRCGPRWGGGHGLCIKTDLGLGPLLQNGTAASLSGLLGDPRPHCAGAPVLAAARLSPSSPCLGLAEPRTSHRRGPSPKVEASRVQPITVGGIVSQVILESPNPAGSHPGPWVCCGSGGGVGTWQPPGFSVGDTLLHASVPLGSGRTWDRG